MEKEKEIYLFHQGTYYHSFNLLGCHLENNGAWFRVWSPNAKQISVIGDFNNWNPESHKLSRIEGSDVWEVFVENTKQFDNYKYQIVTQNDRVLCKADPYAFHTETRPNTASMICSPKYKWGDKKWLEHRAKWDMYHSPVNIYEVHIGSWRKYHDGNFFNYRNL